MVLERAVSALAVLLAAGSIALADEYRPNEFLGMDLSAAVLSPKRLGPPAEFAPVAVEANSEASSEAGANPASEPYWAREELKAEPKEIAVEDVHVTPQHRHASHAKVNSPVRTRLAHRHGNPLDAQATDTRSLRVCIRNLRAKLEPDRHRPRYLITEAGLGYRPTVDFEEGLRRTVEWYRKKMMAAPVLT